MWFAKPFFCRGGGSVYRFALSSFSSQYVRRGVEGKKGLQFGVFPRFSSSSPLVSSLENGKRSRGENFRALKWGGRGHLFFASALCALYLFDEFYSYRVIRRSLRAFWSILYVVHHYKFLFPSHYKFLFPSWNEKEEAGADGDDYKKYLEEVSEIHTKVIKHVVDCLHQNEGLYVKFGQVLASFAMMCPKEYAGPLSTLHDQAMTFSFPVVKDVVEKEMQIDLSGLFESFDEIPVASASVAQVHKARIRVDKLKMLMREGGGGGEEGGVTEREWELSSLFGRGEEDYVDVAVKIQKPNIQKQIYADLFMLWLLCFMMEIAFEIPALWQYDFVTERLKSELDFTIEASNAMKCKKQLSKFDFLPVSIPDVFFCSKRVLITEWVENAVRIDNTKEIENMGIHVPSAVKDAIQIFAVQIFKIGFVHCDPHPGNLLIRKTNDNHRRSIISPLLQGKNKGYELVLLDHGLYVELDEELRKKYAKFWVHMLQRNEQEMTRQCKEWGVNDAEIFAEMIRMRKFSFTEGEITWRFGEEEWLEQPDPLRLKARAIRMLEDQSAFPPALLLVGRCLNYIRATNYGFGNVVSRVEILSDVALMNEGWWTRLKIKTSFKIVDLFIRLRKQL